MDRFIKVIPQKNDDKGDTVHVEEFKRIKHLINENQNVFICGPTGVGKTHLLRQVVDLNRCIEIHKKTTIEYLSDTCAPIVVEDYDAEPLLYKNLVDHVVDNGSVNNRSLIVTSINGYLLPNFQTVFIKPLTFDQLLSIKNGKGAEEAARKSKGSVRNYLNYMENYDNIDDFKTSKEYVKEILCTSDPFPWYDSIPEHGHICDTLQENFVESKGANITRISNSLSEADVFDTYIYNGQWNLLPYYTHTGIRIPKAYLETPLNPNTIRSGSAWTKYGNFKMRFKKFNEIRRKSGNRLGVEEMCLLKRYAELGRFDRLIDYGITPQDFDVMNHLAVTSKLKQRDVTNIKKALKNVIERRE